MIINRYIKKVIVYTFLCIYSFALLKPVMPIVDDVIAHTFYKMQHLATVHFENGKYHVHTELANDANQQKGDTKGLPSGVYETLANHITSSGVFEFNTYSTVQSTNILYKAQHPVAVFIKDPTPPPEV
ncbi:MAG: hypothetical protein JWP12_1874 [Bacteroidetes bacterium]|nr:hypothetical protein [Bacteroidota bacterium]